MFFPLQEYHLDLRCWLALSSRVLHRLAQHFEEKNKNKYSAQAAILADYGEIMRLHWSESKKVSSHTFSILLLQIKPQLLAFPNTFSETTLITFLCYIMLFLYLLRLRKATAINVKAECKFGVHYY